MLSALALVCAVQAPPGEEHLEALRKALELTAAKSYAYEVKGRFERTGEWLPEGVLSNRIKQYQSARHGEKILVKGPEGLWKTAEERLGEKVERPDPDAADIVRTLEGAESPHRIVAKLLEDVDKGRPPEDREMDGVACRRYQLYYKTAALKEAISKQLEKSVQAGGITRPDEVRWSSSMKGSLRLYVDRKDGRLLKAIDEKTVKIAYKVPDQQPDVKTYKLEMEFDLKDWGKSELQLPPEVRERLGLDTDK
jgi:hypothetical protein